MNPYAQQPQSLMDLLNSPQMRGIAQGLLEASGPSSTPVGFGQALGMGMKRGREMDDAERERRLQELMFGVKMQELGQKDQMTPYQQAMIDIQNRKLDQPKEQWEPVKDPMFGSGQRNTKTGEFKPVKTEGTDPQRAQAVKAEALTVVDRLLANQSGVRSNRGGISTIFPNVSDSSVNAQADLETLASLLTTENLGLLKGVLSDTDMKILKDIGAGGLKGADEQVLRNLKTLKQKLGSQLSVPLADTGQSGGWTIEAVE